MGKYKFIFIILIALSIPLILMAAKGIKDKRVGKKSVIQPEVVVDTIVIRQLRDTVFNSVFPFGFPQTINFCGEDVPLNIFYVNEMLDREINTNAYLHNLTMLGLKRANRYFPVIEPILKKNGIPDDFKYMCVIESNLSNVVSNAGAAGFWQLMPETAKQFGLEISDEVDERYNLELATEAVCRYLKQGYELFGNWTVVAASYNGGMRRLSDAAKKQGENSFYNLFLNDETSRFVYRILAIKAIHNNPEGYNFDLKDSDLYPVIPTRVVVVDSTIDSLVEFAKANGVSFKVLKEFNPWLRSWSLINKKGKKYNIIIPLPDYANYSVLKNDM